MLCVCCCCFFFFLFIFLFFFQAEDGIRDLVRSRGLGDVYKRQRPVAARADPGLDEDVDQVVPGHDEQRQRRRQPQANHCLLYTSDAADERSSVDLGGRRIIKKKKTTPQLLRASHI